MKNLMTAFVFTFLSLCSFADNLTLLDGHSYDGEIVRIKKCEVLFKTENRKFLVPAEDIYSVQFSNPSSRILKKYQELSGNDNCLKGSKDAKTFHGKEVLHVGLGFLFGPFAVVGAAVSSPTPQNSMKTMENSANSELFNNIEYLECYEKRARGKNVGNTAIGWGAFIVLILLL